MENEELVFEDIPEEELGELKPAGTPPATDEPEEATEAPAEAEATPAKTGTKRTPKPRKAPEAFSAEQVVNMSAPNEKEVIIDDGADTTTGAFEVAQQQSEEPDEEANTPAETTEPTPAPATNEKDARWYVLHTFSGYEAVAEDNLNKVVEKYELQDRIFEIFIPTEDVVVEKKNKKVLVPTKTMPSYLFIKMIYGDDIWHTITRTRGITGFVGPKGRPLPLTPREVIEMKLERKPNLNVKIEIRDNIHIIDGPLAGQTATVTFVDAATGKVTAMVNMFGRPTSVELHMSQIKKI